MRRKRLNKNKTLTEGLINTNEFINKVINSHEDYTEKMIRFFGGGGVIITLTSLTKLYVTDIDTNETVLFATLKTSPRNHYDWAWELRDKLLDLDIILGRGNWKKELKLNENKTLVEATANFTMSSKGFKTYVFEEDFDNDYVPHEERGRIYDEAHEIALQWVDEGDKDFDTYLMDALRELEQEYLSDVGYVNLNDYYENIKYILDDFLYFHVGNVMDKLESSEHFDKILKERDISVYEVGNFIKEEYDIEIKGGYYSGFSVVITKHDYMEPEYMGKDLIDEINKLVKEDIETNLYPKLEAEGLEPMRIKARFSSGETIYELDESLKSARYTKKLTEVKERVKRYSYYEIDEEVYDVDMWEIWYRDRNTQHIRITNHTGDVYKDKTTYYNRTWERFEYQKVLLKLLNKMYKDEKLIDRIAKQVETNMRHVINETSQQGTNKKELDWLLSLPDGFLVTISACRGKDCSRTNELEKRLQRKNYIRVVGKWDGIEETSFLVFTESESIARALVETGIYEFNQEDVYVWKTPMTMADITEGTNEGTKLDGKYYYFDLDKIIMNRNNIKEK